MKVASALKAQSELLAKSSELPATPMRIASLLLAHTLECEPSKLVLHSQNELSKEQEFEFKQNIKSFIKGTPIEYITQRVSFYSHEFTVLPDVLIPRPETELLVEKVANALKYKNAPKICEIGVGSGVISVILALLLPKAKITATDISQIALKNAKINADKFNVSLNLIQTSLMTGVSENGEKFDAIVSNPPYIAKDYALDKWVLSEPSAALFGGDRGDELLLEIIDLAAARGVPLLACEMGYDQKASLEKALDKNGYKASFYQDLAGFDRGFLAFKKEKI
ncbi:peptide chain release factor N(5)-glutamine methyltransferase [Campylobacter sp. 19-13652]|uniref:peptide chain release factor N(5)-glutamine methyltransferase n=1 Tax=Campylobacter sp. 19-13652 TaxID=2840180 RepID=UPI001C7797F8|nr:peptide chain release factor N(5)-glutamine methyltransferase [Campylobacter sp. 19-13652]BCX79161.1 N5-glutamine S-adenosyl-L-methionine-dependent methyltransferase [Campylobacter sp. 19-13652]